MTSAKYPAWSFGLDIAVGTAGFPFERFRQTEIAAPIGGKLLFDHLELEAGDELLEVDPRPAHLAIFTGIGQRPAMIAEGVARATEMTAQTRQVVLPPAATAPGSSNRISK